MNARREHGYFLIAMVVMLAAFTSVALIRGLNANSHNDAREQLLAMRAMREAKMALIGEAIAEDNTAGAMQCPDTDNDGSADSCNGVGAEQLGCVPWKTLGIPPADQVGIEPLWYALSYAFGNTPTNTSERTSSANQINLGNPGDLTITQTSTGTTANVVAVLLAPGSALTGQTRVSADRCHAAKASEFFETAAAISNSADSKQLVSAPYSDTFNDIVMPIAGNDLYRPLINVVLSQFADTAGTPTRGLRWYFAQGYTPTGLQLFVTPSPATPKAATIMNRDPNSTVFDQQFELTPPLPASPPAGKYLSPQTNGCNLTQTVNASGATTLTSGREASSWLCYNRWYDYISYRAPDDNNASLTLTLTNEHSCTLTVQIGYADKLICI